MDAQLEAYRDRWAESTAIGYRADEALGREKYAAEVLKSPISNESTELYAERDAIRRECVDLATAYVDANKAVLEARFGHLSLEACVAEVSFYRSQGRVEDVLSLEAWLLANFEPQNIGGSGNVTLRRPGR